MTFQPKKLSLVGIALLVASIALIFLSKLAVNQVAFNLFLMSSFTDVAALNMYTLLFAVAGYVLMAAGAVLFVYVAWRSRFVVDAPTVKRQLRVLIVAVAVLLVTLSLFCTQAASANSLATTGYYLATPYSPYDWLIGNFSSGSYYAINGSNWANMMTWPTPAPWSDYAGNSTQVIEAALAATTAGSVYLKEVPMDYGLTIPENVQVIESVNGLTRVFIDDAESQGSPYTVSVDTVQTTYYTVQDCADRYIISWTSTNITSTANSVITSLTSGGTIYWAKGTYNLNGSITGTNKNNIGLFFEEGAKLFVSANMDKPAIYLLGCNGWTIDGVTIDGNYLNQASAKGDLGLTLTEMGIYIDSGSSNNLINNANITNCGQYGIDIVGVAAGPSIHNGITNSLIYNCGWNGIAICGDSAIGTYVKNNEVYNFSDVGITTFGQKTIMQSNYVHNSTWSIGFNDAHWGLGIEGGSKHELLDNTVEFCDAGIQIGFNYSSIKNNHIYNSLGAEYFSWGIVLSNASFNTVENNVLNGGNSYGLKLQVGSYNNTIKDNKICDYGNAAGGGQVGLAVDGNSCGNILDGNEVFDTRAGASRLQSYGILIYAGSNQTKVIGNYANNCPSGSYLDLGAGTIKQDNVIDDAWVE